MKLELDYNFVNKDLLQTALTHTSYSNENKQQSIENNERLEFLGDAVLELTISNYIFKNFKELSEGELTKLRASIVCETSLARKARELRLGDYLRLGKGEEQAGGNSRDSLLSDTFEAIIGAIYLDSNCLEAAEKFIIGKMQDIINEKRESFEMNDCKTYLQELIQKNSHAPIQYEIIKEEGPDHEKVFTVQVKHESKVLGEGNGKSKKDAEQNAAHEAIKLLQSEYK